MFRSRLILLPLGALLLWCALGITFGLVYGQGSPDLALRLWPWSARSLAAESSRIVASGTRPDTASRARGYALQALRREPLNVEALRSLALASALQNDRHRADQLFRNVEQLSRRDLPTEMWLIENSVDRGSVADALEHYDRALRTSLGSRDRLLPILASAAAEPAIVAPLKALLAQRPPWWPAFLHVLLDTKQPATSLAVALEGLHLDPRIDTEHELLSQALLKLANSSMPREAFGFFLQANRTRSRLQGLIRPLNTDDVDAVKPFDWEMAADPDLAATVETQPGNPNAYALRVEVASGREGEIARQLLVLPSGRYSFDFDGGDILGDSVTRPSLTIKCLGSDDLLASFRVPEVATGRASFSFAFVVPNQSCDAEWLSITAATALDADVSRQPWLANFALTRVSK